MSDRETKKSFISCNGFILIIFTEEYYMKFFLHKIYVLPLLLLFLFFGGSKSEAYTLDDFSLVGAGNINGFNSDYFSLTATEPISSKGGGTSTASTDMTFTNLSSTDIQSLIITFDGMAQSTVIHNGGLIETSAGSGVYLNYVSYGSLESGNSLDTPLSLTAAGNSAGGQLTSSKYNIYTIPNIVPGVSVATPEPSEYVLFFFALLFAYKALSRNENHVVAC
jgi:hypothetical protein